MNGLYEKMEITEANIEEMSRLAEDVMHQLYMHYQDYDADGRDIFNKLFTCPVIRIRNWLLREMRILQELRSGISVKT